MLFILIPSRVFCRFCLRLAPFVCFQPLHLYRTALPANLISFSQVFHRQTDFLLLPRLRQLRSLLIHIRPLHFHLLPAPQGRYRQQVLITAPARPLSLTMSISITSFRAFIGSRIALLLQHARHLIQVCFSRTLPWRGQPRLLSVCVLQVHVVDKVRPLFANALAGVGQPQQPQQQNAQRMDSSPERSGVRAR